MQDVRGKYLGMKRSEGNGDARRSDNDIVIASLNERVYFRHCKSHGSEHLHVESSHAVTMARYFTGREGMGGTKLFSLRGKFTR